jgi:ribonuclease P/MRP protein subunit POP3
MKGPKYHQKTKTPSSNSSAGQYRYKEFGLPFRADTVCSLLSPLGHHRRTHSQPSKGKRAARKAQKNDQTPKALPTGTPLPAPELAKKLDVGFNSITRSLESMSASNEEPNEPYAMIFVARGSQSAPFNSHFPQMTGTASKNLPPDQKIRLVGFSKPCSARISQCLGIARVSSVAILRDAPGAEALWSFVQKVVDPVEISWLKASAEPNYKETKIVTSEVPIGNKRVKPS